MSRKNKNKKANEETPQQEEAQNVETPEVETVEQTTEQTAEKETVEDEVAKLKAELEAEKKNYLFLMADFDNFRKRTIKEKADLIKYGGEGAMRNLLPVVDDFERALDAIERGGDIDSLKEGVTLIYNKFVKYLEQNKVTPIESTGKDFDDNLHEAVTTFPAPSEDMRGKVIDTTTKGYMIDDKVLRHAKVVVGQ